MCVALEEDKVPSRYPGMDLSLVKGREGEDRKSAKCAKCAKSVISHRDSCWLCAFMPQLLKSNTLRSISKTN